MSQVACVGALIACDSFDQVNTLVRVATRVNHDRHMGPTSGADCSGSPWATTLASQRCRLVRSLTIRSSETMTLLRARPHLGRWGFMRLLQKPGMPGKAEASDGGLLLLFIPYGWFVHTLCRPTVGVLYHIVVIHPESYMYASMDHREPPIGSHPGWSA